jgi:hypothetical protein
MKKALRDFVDGIMSTTPASWIGILAFTALEVLACCLFLQPRQLATINPGYIIETSHDEYAALSLKLIAFRAQKLDGLHVAYLGGSNATRSLVAHDDETMSAELTNAIGVPAHFDVFTSNNQRLEDALQIVDQFPPSFKGAVVLEMHDGKEDYRGAPARLAANRRRLALPNTPSILPFWRQQGVRYIHTGIFFVDHFDFFAARRIAALRAKPVETEWRGWSGKREPAKYAEIVTKFEKLKEDVEAGDTPSGADRRPQAFTRSRKVLAKLVSNMRKRGIAVLFVEAPRFPPRSAVYAQRIAMFDADMQTFCAETGALSWDPNPDLDLTADDFQDTIHLGSSEKRRQFTDLLMLRLESILVPPPTAPAAPKVEEAGDENGKGATPAEEVKPAASASAAAAASAKP